MAGKDELAGLNAYGDGIGWVRGSVIGRGGFGCVYLATPKDRRRSKRSCLPAIMAVKSAEVSASGTIQKEREVLSNLRGCPYVIRCFGEETTVGDGGAIVYNLLLEYGSGGTLAGRIKESRGGGLPESEVRVYARDVLRGLRDIHGRGYVHCDLKPENVLLVRSELGGAEFRAKMADFGLAKRGRECRKRKLEAYWRGTPMYLPPEAVADGVQEAASDIWAFGCVVLEMLTGRPPWEVEDGTGPEDLVKKIRSGHELPNVPDGLSKAARDFLKGCFVRKPMYRLTADMLLNHPFMEAVADNGVEVEEEEGVEETESLRLVSDDEFGYTSEEDVVSCWSEDDDYLFNSGEGVVTSSSSLDQAKGASQQESSKVSS